MDELQKGVFVAQHAGNSVRIVLPFSKITMVEKPSVFQFAANIKIKFVDDGGQEDVSCISLSHYYNLTCAIYQSSITLLFSLILNKLTMELSMHGTLIPD